MKPVNVSLMTMNQIRIANRVARIDFGGGNRRAPWGVLLSVWWVFFLGAPGSGGAEAEVGPEPVASVSSTAADSSAAAPGTLGAFKIIMQRNIFNANRVRVIDRPAVTNAPPPTVQAFSLHGTLLSKQGHYAFFEGSESAYQAVLEEGQSIAGHTVAKILEDSVMLKTTNEIEVELPMLMQMERLGDGPWQVKVGTAASSGGSRDRGASSPRMGGGRDAFSSRRDRGDGSTVVGRRSAPTSSSRDGGGAVESGGSPEEILKRLMEQRAKEENQ